MKQLKIGKATYLAIRLPEKDCQRDSTTIEIPEPWKGLEIVRGRTLTHLILNLMARSKRFAFLKLTMSRGEAAPDKIRDVEVVYDQRELLTRKKCPCPNCLPL